MSENNDYESELDGSFFEQAITIAENIPTNLSPRPPVGAVITKNGNIIGKGATSPTPGNHAEINAILDCTNNNFSTEGATMFTTLEPCFHEGETSPCVDRIIDSGISRIFVGAIDP
ncbi:MAG: riboflavin biosynthesis protein RibD, partial [Chloroflexi bacterium]|nr:riboflavin biosynthesis protein RibD [Chloroflexota bacterium]